MVNKYIFTVDNMPRNGCAATIRQGPEADLRIQIVDIKLSRKEVTTAGDLTVEEVVENIRNSGCHPLVGKMKQGLPGKLFFS